MTFIHILLVCLRMLKAVDKKAIVVIKQVVIVETITTTKERT